MNEDKKIIPVGSITIDTKELKVNAPCYDALPVMATRDFVLFPGVAFPITIGREATLAVAREAKERHVPIGVFCQTDPAIEAPGVGDLHHLGVVADVLQVIDLPDDNHTALLQAREKIRITGSAKAEPQSPAFSLCVSAAPVKESHPRANDKEFMMIAGAVRESIVNLSRESGNSVPEEVIFGMDSVMPPDVMINLVSTQAPFPVEFKQELLGLNRLKERAYRLLIGLGKNEQLAEINRDIQMRTKERIDEAQRNAFLQHQLDVIRQELYGEVDDATRLREQAASVNFSEAEAAQFAKEVDKLERLSPQSPDYAVQYSFLETLLALPWRVNDPLSADFAFAEQTLDEDHYGLEKVKERILEQIAVIINNPEGKAPILCLVGAPGVGKTSLGKSIAKAMGRRYQRVSLGGLHDEAEIRGHRRTYIGAMPGRIIDAMRRAGSSNPVLLLDEVDKIGADFKGDPSAALLEVLDPEQNCRFHDNYVDMDFDLSNVFFIATANTLAPVPQPLLDRMEVIDISGYLLEEKIEIARRHLLPRLVKELNVADLPEISNEALTCVIESYTAESGVRQLEKQLAKILRRLIMDRLKGNEAGAIAGADDVKRYLGAPKFTPDRYEGNDFAGVVTGLAWTQAGGEILYIEASLSPAKAFGLELTGNLGNVMKESATIAAHWVKAHSAQLGIDPEIFNNHALNIHAPEGAIPKDGPSAGIAIVTAIVSACLKRKVRARLAMTGEITLRGRVLPVGGIKEKILAAKRAGITDVMLCSQNRKDVEEIPQRYLAGLNVIYIDTIAEGIRIAVTDEQAQI